MPAEPSVPASSSGRLFGLARACQMVPELADAGIGPHVVRRWAMAGLRRRGSAERIKLEHIRVGARLFVTEDGVRRFLNQINNGEQVESPSRDRWLNQRLMTAGL